MGRKGEGKKGRFFVCKSYLVSICFLVFVFFAGNSLAQKLDLLAEQIRSGNSEQKRDTLFQIRNLRSDIASRIAIPPLSDADEMVRATAASSVIYLPKTEAVTLLLPLLNDKAAFVRREAAYALGEIGDPSASSALIRTLEDDRDPEVRSAAVAALGKTGDTSVVVALSSILTRSPREEDGLLRRFAARSIGQIAQIIGAGKRQAVTPTSFLPEKYKDTPVRQLTVAELSHFQKAVLVLIRVLQNTKEADDTQREAAFALGAIGDRSALPALQANLNSTDNYLAEICKEALQKLQLPQ